MYLTLQEATKVLTDKLKQEFADENGEIDVIKAAATIYDNPLLYEKEHGFKRQIKIIEDIIESPQGHTHSSLVWKWAGLKLTKVFKVQN